MKRAVAFLVILSVICCLLSGCDLWTAGDYLSISPHEPYQEVIKDTIVEVSSYPQLRSALSEIVSNCAESGLISIKSFSNATVDYYVNTAINFVKTSTALGAYAVEDITYELGVNRGISVVAFDIRYCHSRSEILGIQQVGSGDEMINAVTTALDQGEPYLALHTNNYESIDFIQFVQEYSSMHPDIVMEIPKVAAFLYPQRGSERIVELIFTYQTERDDLRKMQQRVAEVFTSAELYVKDTTQVKDIYSRLFSFLMERDEYTIETSITPAYSLLQHGVGDSRAFANVYAEMCRRAELDCSVVSGTRDAEPWCWNLVRYRGKYYHVDLLRCSESDEFIMNTDAEMLGYVWDYSAYPSS